MDKQAQFEIIKEAISVFIRDLSTTKKGKLSKHKYSKNKQKIFLALTVIDELNLEFNQDKIVNDFKQYLDNFVNVKDINIGDKIEFKLK